MELQRNAADRRGIHCVDLNVCIEKKLLNLTHQSRSPTRGQIKKCSQWGGGVVGQASNFNQKYEEKVAVLQPGLYRNMRALRQRVGVQ